MSKYVIIGNSAGAVGCVEGIRSIDKDGEITLIASEPHHTYSRPLISYLLYGKTDEQRMKYRPDSFYKDNKVKKMLGKTVVSIDKKEKKVILSDGKEIEYEKLMTATGSVPFIPPMYGLDKVKKKFSFMTLDDAHKLGKAITPNSKVLIVGAGLIGLKCAEGINDKVESLTVVDLADRILPSILDKDGSAIVQKHIESEGVKFCLGDSVKAFEKNKATLVSGAEIDFDVLVLAVGVRPCVSLISDIDGKVNRGIITDEKCKTSIKDIYAAGDCTESHDVSSNSEKVMALLPNAYMQGHTAGINMAGGNAVYDNAIPMNAIGFFGLHIITAGTYDGDCYTHVSDGSYKKLFYKSNHLKGYIMIGDINRAGIYTSLIKKQTPLSSIDFDLIKDKPQLMAFSKKIRKDFLAK